MHKVMHLSASSAYETLRHTECRGFIVEQ